MKKMVLILVMLGFGLQAFAQSVLYSEKIIKEKIPLIVEAVETDYPGLAMEKIVAMLMSNADKGFSVNKNIKSSDDSDIFAITSSDKAGRMTVTYDRSGNRLSKVEHRKNVAPPLVVRNSLEKSYPGWKVAKNSYYMSTNFKSGKINKYFKFDLTNVNKKIKINTDANGKILNKPRERKIKLS